MDRFEKAVQKLTGKEKKKIREIIKALQSGRFDNLDIKKLRGGDDIFRVRKGGIRIIYQIRNNRTFILKVGRRKEDTYNF